MKAKQLKGENSYYRSVVPKLPGTSECVCEIIDHGPRTYVWISFGNTALTVSGAARVRCLTKTILEALDGRRNKKPRKSTRKEASHA